MPKKKLTQIALEQEVEFEDAMEIAQDKLPEGSLTGKGKTHGSTRKAQPS